MAEQVFRAAAPACGAAPASLWVTSDTVDVWLISTDVTDSVLTELETLLDDDERERAGNLLSAARRRQFIASHGAVRVILGRLLGMPPGSLRWRRGPHGKPELAFPGGFGGVVPPGEVLTAFPGGFGGVVPPGEVLTGAGPQVSMSKSDGLAALAVTGSRRIGVDIQRLPPDLDMTRMAQRFYPPREALFVSSAAETAERADRFTKLWVRKEACVKVSGGRLVPGLQLTVLRAGVTTADSSLTSADSYMVRDLRVPLGFRGAVAAEGTRPFRITRHWM